MNILSLFDGMSCGQLALKKADIPITKYYASEIDKYAIQIAKKNFPQMEHVGDVTELSATDLPNIDLLMGGSPCQGFSFAGKQLNFDDPRSALFFEFVRLLNETKPRYFLLENVRMKQEFQDVISDALGVKPIMINSSLLSAQNRVRLYWTNIPNVTQPEDRGIVLKDILEGYDGVAVKDTDRNRRHYKEIDQKSLCMSATMYKGAGNNGMTLVPRPCEMHEAVVFKNRATKDTECHHVATAMDINGHDCIKRVYADSGKSPTLNACTGGNREPKVLVVKEATKKGYTEIQDGDCFDATFPTSKTRRGRNMKDKSNCLTAANYEYMRYEHPTYRKLTPLECERLQTVPDNYTEGVSNSQRYKMLGNGWTVDVIAHIFSTVPRDEVNKRSHKYIDLNKRDFLDQDTWTGICDDLEFDGMFCDKLRIFTDFTIIIDDDDTHHDRTMSLQGSPTDKELRL